MGLTNADVPAEYGGSDMDKVSSAIIADRMAKCGSFVVSMGAHAGIGTLPIVFFGTEAQKKKYLPKLASAEMIGAYALSEGTSGSDALNSRTKAVLSPDGKHYILNGEKMWITNAHFADLFTVFAKVDGEKFTAFLIEKDFPGFSVGAEEKKMGIRGSSTAPLILNDCKVPVENVLGDIGKGHIIAFNILNVGRFKLGAGCVGGARTSLQNAIAYAKDRKAFGKSISNFGLIREKLAQMAVGIYTGESMVYRTVGMMDTALGEIEKNPETIRKSIEEYAVECSIIKVWGSEMLDMVVDETVQIYGGYGFVEEYPAERAYRDSRVNRIFEGTNEINRLIITGWLLKRAMSGQLALLPAIKKVMDEVMAGPSGEELEGARWLRNASWSTTPRSWRCWWPARLRRSTCRSWPISRRVMGAIADMVIEAFAMDSALLRARKYVEALGEEKAALVVAMTQVYLEGAFARLEAAAKKVVAAVAEGDMLRTQMAIVRRLAKHEPVNVIALQEKIASRVLETGQVRDRVVVRETLIKSDFLKGTAFRPSVNAAESPRLQPLRDLL
jgi:alkylation response protein AidB-like acyl-CoA dehydrogenase